MGENCVTSKRGKDISLYILEYASWRVCREFIDQVKVAGVWRDMIPGLLHDIQVENSEIEAMRSTLNTAAFILRLLDLEGDESVAKQDCEDKTPTVHPIEETLPVFDRITKQFPYSECQVAEMRSNLKSQAVLSCCRAENFPLANEVLERQFGNGKHTDEKRSELQQLLTRLQYGESGSEVEDYSIFLRGVAVFLSDVVNKMDKPRLEMIDFSQTTNDNPTAEANSEVRDTIRDREELNDGVDKDSGQVNVRKRRKKRTPIKAIRKDPNSNFRSKSQTNKTLDNMVGNTEDDEDGEVKSTVHTKNQKGGEERNDSSVDDTEVKDKHSTPSKSATSTGRNIISLRTRLSNTNTPCKGDNVTPCKGDNVSPCTSRKIAKISTPTSSSKRVTRLSERIESRKLMSKPARMLLWSEGSESENSGSSPSFNTARIQRPIVSSPSIRSYTKNKRIKKYWTSREEEDLKEGVERYGIGNWVAILEEFHFPGRTNVDLKDKWRNMSKKD